MLPGIKGKGKAMTLSKNTKQILLFVLIAAVCAVLAGVCIKLAKLDKTKTLPSYSYTIGTISESDGKITEAKTSIYSKDFTPIKDMKIEIADEATITYKVAFYDKDKKFISLSASKSAAFDATAPEGAEYFRVMITPNEVDGKAVEITTLDVYKYAKQLTVTYSK